MNTQHKTEGVRASQLRLPRTSKIALGAGTLALVAGLGWKAVSSTESPSATPAKKAAKSQSVDFTAGQYKPSEFAGVEVRSRPEASTPDKSAAVRTGNNAGSIYVKPGAALPPASAFGPVTNGTVGKRIVPGRSPLGGKALYLPESSLPFASAKIGAAGRVVLKCDRNGKPHSAAEHAKHAITQRADKVQKSQP